MIHSDAQERPHKHIIDLCGPEGNAFYLLGTASDYAKKLGLDSEEILTEMKSSDYSNLVNTMDKYFGSFIEFYNAEQAGVVPQS